MDKRIFIIEDDVNTLYGLQAKFSIDGYRVSTSSGNESLEELKQKIKDSMVEYIILDIILPKLDGFEILQAIKSDEKTAKIMVFVFTSLADADTKNKCERLGAAHVFVKNKLRLDDLIEKIKKIILNREKIKLN